MKTSCGTVAKKGDAMSADNYLVDRRVCCYPGGCDSKAEYIFSASDGWTFACAEHLPWLQELEAIFYGFVQIKAIRSHED